MLGLNTSYLKYIILAVLLYGLVLVVNNKLLANEEQKDGFKNDDNSGLNAVVTKLEDITDKLSNVFESFEQLKKNEEEIEDEEDDDEDDDDDVEPQLKIPESPKNNNKKNKKNRKNKKNNDDDTEEFTNYTTGVASSFGGNYLLL